MVGFYAFQPSVSSLYAQGSALAAISTNIANITTDGYKRAETAFATVMSRTVASSPGAAGESAPRNVQSDLGGVTAISLHRIAEAGAVRLTGNNLDAAINGSGFFVFAPDSANPATTVYGRAGHFGFIPGGPGQSTSLLTDTNGFAVLGWPVTATGTAATQSPPRPISIDFGATADPGRATTRIAVSGDLPPTTAAGSAVPLGLEAYDLAASPQPLALTLTKQAANLWSIAVEANTGTTVTVEPAGAPGQPATLAFDGLGRSLAPAAFTMTITEPGGAVSTVQLDLSAIRQQGGADNGLSFVQDGYPSGALLSVAFDGAGRMVGSFSNGRTLPLFQLAIADFVNPDGLAPLSGTVYGATELSGAPSIGIAGDGPRGTIVPGAIEQSNVDLAQEFSRMILVQHAYNSASTAFRTVDEMTQVARDLKRV